MTLARPYDNVRILELTRELGPYAGRLFADLGAEVIRVELPQRDDARNAPPLAAGGSVPFEYLNVSKKSIVVDYRTDAGREILRDLAARADIVLYEPEDVRAECLPLLVDAPGARVVTLLSYFGLTGPYAGYAGCDLVAQAAGGLAWLSGRPDGPPLRLAGEQGWFVTALYAATATAMALWDKECAGRSHVVDVSAQECIAHSLQNTLEGYTLERRITRRGGEGTRDATENIFACQDGYVFLAAPLQMTSTWDNLVRWLLDEKHPGAESLQGPEWRDLSQRVQRKAHDTFRAIFETFAATRTKADLLATAMKRKVILAPVSTIAETLSDPQLAHRDFFRSIRHSAFPAGLVFPGAPYRMSEPVWSVAGPAPKAGQDDAEILGPASRTARGKTGAVQ